MNVDEKKTLQLTVSETDWEGIQFVVEALGCTGVSDLLEKIGSKQLTVVNIEKLEDRLDLHDALEALAESDERILYEQVRQELGLTSVQD